MAHRYFLPSLPAAGPHRLEGDLAHHLGRVLRLRAGDAITLGDGRGGTATAQVTAVDKHTVAVEVASARTEAPLALQLTLAFCVPRLQRSEWLLEHGTEVGVAAFQPLWTARTRPQGERPERWQRIVQAAAGQCDRAWLPEVRPARELSALVAMPDLASQRVVASENGANDVGVRSGECVLLVGPEGGFDAAELAAIAGAGFVAQRFGPHTLRTETAALVGAAVMIAGCGRGGSRRGELEETPS